MARVDVTSQQLVMTGLTPATTVPTIDGDVVDTGRVALYVENTGIAAVTVTVLSTATVDGLAVEDLIVSVPAGATKLIGPLPVRAFGQPSGAVDEGRAYVNYSVPADVLRAVVAL